MDPATKDILRYVILLAAAPIWVPFLRVLWRDFNEALRPEGGLLGQALSPRELERLERESPIDSRLVSEEIVTPEKRAKTRMKTPTAGPAPREGRTAAGPGIKAALPAWDKRGERGAERRMGPRPRSSGFRT